MIKGFGVVRPKRDVKIRLVVSELTGKRLVQMLFDEVWHTISPHYKRENAVAASTQVKQVFGQCSLKQLRNSGYLKALNQLDYEDDDIVLGVYRNGRWASNAETRKETHLILDQDVVAVEEIEL